MACNGMSLVLIFVLVVQIALTRLLHWQVQSVVAIYEDRHNLVTVGPDVQLFQHSVAVRRVKVIARSFITPDSGLVRLLAACVICECCCTFKLQLGYNAVTSLCLSVVLQFSCLLIHTTHTPTARLSESFTLSNTAPASSVVVKSPPLLLLFASVSAGVQELEALTGGRYFLSFMLEAGDILLPLVKSCMARVSAAVSWLLVKLIGRALGLIYRGVKQSLTPQNKPKIKQQSQDSVANNNEEQHSWFTGFA